MILKYNEYIIEDVDYYEKYNIIYKYIINYLNSYHIKNLFNLSENFYREDKLVNLFVKFNNFVILTISSKEELNNIYLTSLKDTKDFDDINLIKEYINEYFDNFYIYLYDYYINGKYSINVKINNIPIINIEKYFEFLEKIYLNYKNIKAFKKYPDFLKVLEHEFNIDIILKRFKVQFYEKFQSYFNAKKFDLI